MCSYYNWSCYNVCYNWHSGCYYSSCITLQLYSCSYLNHILLILKLLQVAITLLAGVDLWGGDIFPRHYQWIYAKGYATRTQISIGGVQDQDTLIEQSPNYSNRTFSVRIEVWNFSKSACAYTYNEVHWSVYKV